MKMWHLLLGYSNVEQKVISFIGRNDILAVYPLYLGKRYYFTCTHEIMDVVSPRHLSVPPL